MTDQLDKRVQIALKELAETARELARISTYMQKDGNAMWQRVAHLAGNITNTLVYLETGETQ